MHFLLANLTGLGKSINNPRSYNIMLEVHRLALYGLPCKKIQREYSNAHSLPLLAYSLSSPSYNI